MPIRRVALVLAMAAEAAPLRQILGAGPLEAPAWAAALPTRLSAARVGNVELVIAENGIDPVTGVDCVGTQAAALTTQVVIAAHAPDLVISAGTAGGFDRFGARVGDTYLAWPSFVYHDRRIALPGFDRLGRGDHPAADVRDLAAELGFRTGVVTTGDSLDESPTDAKRIAASGAEVKDMEAAAVAWVARLHQVPVTAVKVITDLVDAPAPTEDQFITNLNSAVDQLRTAVPDVLSRLASIELAAPTLE